MTTAELLEREIRNTRASISNGLHTRKHHPTYGVKKADLTAKLHFLRGLLAAWHVVTTGEAGVPGWAAREASLTLGIDLAEIRQSIKEAK